MRLYGISCIAINKMYESDASKPSDFHKMPDHIRKILYLDACDLIVEKDNEPVFSIEITTEAGTGHNAFQRFARIAASVENSVPAFYIYPEGVIVTRQNTPPRWDKINPLVFRALESVMSIYQIPALLYYFPSDIMLYQDQPEQSPNLIKKDYAMILILLDILVALIHRLPVCRIYLLRLTNFFRLQKLLALFRLDVLYCKD